MKKSIQNLVLPFLMMFGCFQASAAIIYVDPITQVVDIGDTVSVNISIKDLAADQVVGDYDMDISFNSAVVSLDSIDFSLALDAGIFGSFPDWSDLGGMANINDLSFEDALDLVSHQTGNFGSDFILATMNFTAVGFGTSAIDFSTVWALGDQLGDAIQYTTKSGSVVVRQPKGIPEPSSVLLLVAGLTFIARKKRI